MFCCCNKVYTYTYVISTLYLLSSTYTLRIVAMILIMALQYIMGRCVYDISPIQDVFSCWTEKRRPDALPALRRTLRVGDAEQSIQIAVIMIVRQSNKN